MESWILGVQRIHAPSYNAACARALGSLGWAPAERWLEEQYMRQPTAALLSGLLAASARGRVAPSLCDPEVLSAALKLVDEALAQDGARVAAEAGRFARGLALIGPTSRDGRSLLPVLLDGVERATLSAPARWVRMTAAEGLGLIDAEGRRGCSAFAARRGQNP